MLLINSLACIKLVKITSCHNIAILKLTLDKIYIHYRIVLKGRDIKDTAASCSLTPCEIKS